MYLLSRRRDRLTGVSYVSTSFGVLSLRSGRRRIVSAPSRLEDGAEEGTTVTGLDLVGDRVAIGLELVGDDCGRPPAEGDKVEDELSELFAGPVAGVRRIAGGCGGEVQPFRAPSWHRGAVFSLVRTPSPIVERRELGADGRTIAEIDVPSGTDAAAIDETGSYVVVFRSARETGAKADAFDVVELEEPPPS